MVTTRNKPLVLVYFQAKLQQDIPSPVRGEGIPVRQEGKMDTLEQPKAYADKMWGTSPKMQELLAQIRKVAVTAVPVLLVGEKGTGKSLATRIIHELSPRHSDPFTKINCNDGTPRMNLSARSVPRSLSDGCSVDAPSMRSSRSVIPSAARTYVVSCVSPSPFP